MYRFGYDAKRLFNNFTGLGNYSRTLLRNLATYYPDNAYFLYTPKLKRHSETQFFTASPAFHVYQPNGPFKSLWRSWGVNRDLRRHRVQLYHGLSHEIPVGLHRRGIASVVTIHDLIFHQYPDQYQWADRRIYDAKFSYSCRHADLIVAISESTKTDIINDYGIAPEKVRVVYQSCHERFQKECTYRDLEEVRQRLALPPKYFLYVGSIIERKNLLGIVQALTQLPADLRLPLVIVGSGKEYLQKVVDFARHKGVLPLLQFVNPEPDDFPALYQQAEVFLYPSYAEGFGIPIIEALFSQTPVITSNRSSLPEAAGPDAWLVDPSRPDAIAAGIEKIMTDDAFRQNMIEKGSAYARRFNGEDVTAQMMEAYLSVLEQ